MAHLKAKILCLAMVTGATISGSPEQPGGPIEGNGTVIRQTHDAGPENGAGTETSAEPLR